MAATVLMGTVMAGLITAKSRFSKQQVSSRQRIEAVQVADKLLEHWWITGGVENASELKDEDIGEIATLDWPSDELPGSEEVPLPDAMPRNGVGISPDDDNWMWRTAEVPGSGGDLNLSIIRLELFDLRTEQNDEPVLAVEIVAPAPPKPDDDELLDMEKILNGR